jgi:alginate O-acetyltransferase complex protein AlgI
MTKRTERCGAGSNEEMIQPFVIALPPLIWVLLAFALRPHVPAWGFMWVLAYAVFLSCKWISVAPVLHRMRGRLLVMYMITDPGMDAGPYLKSPKRRAISKSEVVLGLVRAIVGAALAFVVAPRVSSPVSGLAALFGLVLTLHFGVLHLVSLVLQYLRRSTKPLMNHPLRSLSLTELWSQRWNTGFSDLARNLIFRPVARRAGAAVATGAVFVASGLVHDLVISLPAGGGYGLPTVYFGIQFLGILIERTTAGRTVRRRWPMVARAFTVLIALTPLPLLFHGAFLQNVILPFVRAVGLPGGAS